MKTEFWLAQSATKNGAWWRPAIPKTSKNKPVVGRNTVAIKVVLDIPDSYFELPELKANITLPDIRSDAPSSHVEMEQRIAEQLKESLGVNVTFVVEENRD